MAPLRWSPYVGFSLVLVVGGLSLQSTVVVLVQLLSLFLWPFSADAYYSYIALTMRMWSQSLIAIVQLFAPSKLLVTFDDSCVRTAKADGTVVRTDVQDLVIRNKQGDIVGISFPERIVVTANHQIYGDWIYIWFIAYLAKAHGAMKILLKDSLKYIPFYGLVRTTPLICDKMRQRSKEFAERNNMKDNQFTLLPRSTGLNLCMSTLDDSVDWLYDLTIGYPGIKPGDNPEDVLTLKKIFFLGQYPSYIHIHIRRYPVKSIPKDSNGFSKWLFERWVEKDEKMVYFYKEGRLPGENEGASHDMDAPLLGSANTFKIPIHLRHPVREILQPWFFLLPYLPLAWLITSVFGLLYSYASAAY
ncbi:hypothetical protein DFQ29_008877 [Apophysomyces sp. BC1021]|nr:hypothetical protein DFQ29_008877 [Apophysomyces sp. BC1021]